MSEPGRIKRILNDPAKNGMRFGIAAGVFFGIWLYNTRLFYGHYEHSYGPGWLIGIATIAVLVGIGLAAISLFRAFTGKRMTLTLLLAVLALPICFLAFFQMLEFIDSIVDYLDDTFDWAYVFEETTTVSPHRLSMRN